MTARLTPRTAGWRSASREPAGGAGVPTPRDVLSGGILIGGLLLAVLAVGLWHLTQGTSGIGARDLVRALNGEEIFINGVSAGEVFLGSRLPRLCAGIAVGFALGVAGALLQSITRNHLASPDTLAVTSGAYFSLTVVAAFGIAVPVWASGGVAFAGGLLAAALVLGLTGRSSGTASTRLILAGSAISMALGSGTAMLLILFEESTEGLFAWGNGSIAQLNLDAALRAAPVIAAMLVVALLLTRRLDVISLSDDAAASLGVPVRRTRTWVLLCAVVLSSIAVTLAGPIAFVGLGAPVLARLLASRVHALRRHVLLVPVAGLLGSLIILIADVTLRALLTAEGAITVPTGIPTALLGGIIIMVLAIHMRDAGTSRTSTSSPSKLRSRRRFIIVLTVLAIALALTIVFGLLAGNLWLRLGDLWQWVHAGAPALIDRALDERFARVAAAVFAGAALALSGTIVQGTVRNPLAEPSLLGITAGAGLGAAFVVTTGFAGGGRPAMIVMAVLAGLLTFALVAIFAWRGGLLPDRFVLVGIGMGYVLTAMTTFLLLRSDPWATPRMLTWLSGTTYGRSLADVFPVALTLLIVLPVVIALRRQLDLLAVDEDTPRILGISVERTRLSALVLAALLAAVAVIAVGTVGFVGLVAPHLARTLVGARHGRVIPVALVIGALLVLIADTLGRTVISPSQLPAGLMVALVGAPYLVWLMRRSRG